MQFCRSPPRPSPGSVTYSDDDDTKGYDENCDSSSLTEKPSEMSSSESQVSGFLKPVARIFKWFVLVKFLR